MYSLSYIFAAALAHRRLCPIFFSTIPIIPHTCRRCFNYHPASLLKSLLYRFPLPPRSSLTFPPTVLCFCRVYNATIYVVSVYLSPLSLSPLPYIIPFQFPPLLFYHYFNNLIILYIFHIPSSLYNSVLSSCTHHYTSPPDAVTHPLPLCLILPHIQHHHHHTCRIFFFPSLFCTLLENLGMPYLLMHTTYHFPIIYCVWISNLSPLTYTCSALLCSPCSVLLYLVCFARSNLL